MYEQNNELYEYNNKLNQFQLLKGTKELVQNTSRFNGYMRHYESVCEMSGLSNEKLPPIVPAINQNSYNNNHLAIKKSSLNHSSSALILRKPGLNESILGEKK